jgi:hypothetical protein
MQQSIFLSLVGRVTVALFAPLDLNQRDMLLSSENEAIEEIRGEFDAIIGTYLDEKSDLFTLTLLPCCLEQPTLFSLVKERYQR